MATMTNSLTFSNWPLPVKLYSVGATFKNSNLVIYAASQDFKLFAETGLNR
jgi:hypothetical protein